MSNMTIKLRSARSRSNWRWVRAMSTRILSRPTVADTMEYDFRVTAECEPKPQHHWWGTIRAHMVTSFDNHFHFENRL